MADVVSVGIFGLGVGVELLLVMPGAQQLVNIPFNAAKLGFVVAKSENDLHILVACL